MNLVDLCPCHLGILISLPNLTLGRDVAIIFHSHCLSPFRFYADMVCRNKIEALWNKGIAFPLERLHHLITTQTWSDPDSELMWNKRFPNAPYQVWREDPTSTTAVAPVLQDVEFQCPVCDRTGTIELLKFQKMHLTKTAKIQCPYCPRVFDADMLSAYFLKKDLSKFTYSDGEWYFEIGLTSDNIGESREWLLIQMELVAIT